MPPHNAITNSEKGVESGWDTAPALSGASITCSILAASSQISAPTYAGAVDFTHPQTLTGATTVVSGLTLDSGGTPVIDLNGVADALVLDADGDTTISAPTGNQIDVEIAGADDFVFVANTFRALSGSAVETNTINETTAASGVTIDSVLVKDGGVVCPNPTTGLGYSTGAGGTVTQLTSKSTGATLSKVCGQITMHNESLAAGTIVSFVLTNTAIAATDVLVLNHISGGTVGSYTLNAQCAAGSATINVRNNTAGALGEAIVIQFVVIKGVNA